MAFGTSLNKILGVILIIVVLPIFAGLGMLSADFNRLPVIGATASAGIVSMGDIIIQFMPIFGIGADDKELSLPLLMNMKNHNLNQWHHIYPDSYLSALPLPYWRDSDCSEKQRVSLSDFHDNQGLVRDDANQSLVSIF